MNQANSSMAQQMLQAFQGQHLETAERLAKLILKSKPKDLVALQILGLSLAMRGRISEAVESFYKAAQLDQKNPELLSNLAKAQHGAELYGDAIQTYKKLDRLAPNNPQILTDMATAFAKARIYDEAARLFDRAISIQPDYFLAWSNQGNLYAEMFSAEEAITSYEKAIEINPAYTEAWTNYGNALYDLGRLQEARLAHEKALSLNPEYAEAWSNYANTLLELQDPGHFAAQQKAFLLKPNHPFLAGQLFFLAKCICDWELSESLASKILSGLGSRERLIHPFVLLQINSSLQLQKVCAEIFIRDRFPFSGLAPLPAQKNLNQEKKIRIGYFSYDFKEHPVGVLIENIIRLHDRSRFEIYGFFLNKNTGDDQEKILNELFDQSFNIFGLGNFPAIDLIRLQEIDIAVDLNGHTKGAGTGLFAKRLAPIQVNYLGYAGTSGADFYDALISDRIAIPPEHQIHYTEEVAYLPNSFFPVDTKVSIESLGDIPSKASQGLPDFGFIFTCFNNSYKITSEIFDIWMNILKEIPGSILWLSKPPPEAILNLQNEAKKRGVDPSRLIFARRTPGRAEHLSRLRLADLFLDTPIYNAHATAADALWVGVPLLTLVGETFAGRVAASQVNALGLSELIVRSERDYFEKAVELARHPDLLRSIRAQLEANRSSSALFDTKQYVKDLESLYMGLLNKAN